GHVVPWPCIDDLNRLTLSELGRQLLDGHRRYLLRGRVFGRQCLIAAHGGDPLNDRGPVDGPEERVDVRSRICAAVELVRMLVHVEYENRRRIDGTLCVVAGDLISEALVAARVREKHPPGAASERLRRPHELTPPEAHASEVLLEHRTELIRNFVPVQ